MCFGSDKGGVNRKNALASPIEHLQGGPRVQQLLTCAPNLFDIPKQDPRYKFRVKPPSSLYMFFSLSALYGLHRNSVSF